MSQFYKQLIFIFIIIAIITAGGLIIREVNNRGDDVFIYLKFNEGYGSICYYSTKNDNDIISTVLGIDYIL